MTDESTTILLDPGTTTGSPPVGVDRVEDFLHVDRTGCALLPGPLDQLVNGQPGRRRDEFGTEVLLE